MSPLKNKSAVPAAGTTGHGEVQSPESCYCGSVSAEAQVSEHDQDVPPSPMKDSTSSVEGTLGSFSQALQAAAAAPLGPDEDTFPHPLLEDHLARPAKSEDLAIKVRAGNHEAKTLPTTTSFLTRDSFQPVPLEDGPASEPTDVPRAPIDVAPAADSPQSMKALIMGARKDPSSTTSMIGTRKELAGVSVHKMPPKFKFHRVRSDSHPLVFDLLGVTPERGDKEYYVVGNSELAAALRSDPYFSKSIGTYRLALIVDPQGVFGWWAVDLLADHDWADSARAICGQLEVAWARVESGSSRYEMLVAEGDLGEPIWPEIDDETLLEKSFGKRFITSMDHPILRKLRGNHV
jgi:hypothetical protein